MSDLDYEFAGLVRYPEANGVNTWFTCEVDSRDEISSEASKDAEIFVIIRNGTCVVLSPESAEQFANQILRQVKGLRLRSY